MPGQLLAEIKQTRPFPSLEEEAALSLARSAALQDHAAAALMAPYDITPTQYNVLRILRGAGAPGLCRGEITERLINRTPDVTRLLDRMEAAGLVVRERSGDDRRLVMTRITRQGTRLLAQLEGPVHQFHQQQFGHLGARDLAALIDLLARYRAGLAPG